MKPEQHFIKSPLFEPKEIRYKNNLQIRRL